MENLRFEKMLRQRIKKKYKVRINFGVTKET
jgi:hypothetical protein